MASVWEAVVEAARRAESAKGAVAAAAHGYGGTVS